MLHVWNIYLQNWTISGVNVDIHIPAPWSIWVDLPIGNGDFPMKDGPFVGILGSIGPINSEDCAGSDLRPRCWGQQTAGTLRRRRPVFRIGGGVSTSNTSEKVR